MIQLILVAALVLPAAQTPTATPAQASTPPATPQSGVAWSAKGLQAAIAEAHEKQKLVMVFITTQVTTASQKMENEVFSNERVVSALADTICVRVDYDKQRDVADRFRIAAKDLPVVLWINSDGSARERVNGVTATDVFLANTSRIRADLGTINEVRRKILTNEKDLEARFELYRRLREVGDTQGADTQKVAIQKLDPQGISRGSRHFRYEQITTAIEQHWAQTQQLDLQKVGELQTFVEGESDPEIVWDGWMRLSNTNDYWATQATKEGKLEEARDHRAKRRQYFSYAWRGVPANLLREFGVYYANLFWEQKDELSPEDKEFLVSLTDRLVQVFDRDAMAHDLSARALMIAGRRDAALKRARTAVELDPANSLYQGRVKELGG